MGLSTPSTGGGAPKDAEYVTGSSDSELTSETVVSPANDILTSGSFGSTVSLSPGFGTFTQIDADNPALLYAVTRAQNSSNQFGRIQLEVDESGGTTPDYTATISFASVQLSSGTYINNRVTVPIPAGGQFQIVNERDPNAANEIRLVRALIITP